MKILVSGATGMVGSSLIPTLSAEGHEVTRLVRGAASGPGAIRWDPAAGALDAASLEGFDAVVHLAGENIASGRWTPARKARILESRTKGTALLASALSRLQHPPKTFISASAIGYYGNRGDELLDENSPSGEGYLADVCRQWEAASAPLSSVGVRVVRLRIGIILSSRGGALAKMLLPFRMGVGGKIGSGGQYMSWITLTDLCSVIRHVLATPLLEGNVNVVAPKPVTNIEFTHALAGALRRPAIFPLPAFAARLALGEMADELLLASTRVSSGKLEASGFAFRHRELRPALEYVLREKV